MDNPIVFNIAPVVASRPRVTRWGTYFAKKYSNFREEFAELLTDYKAIPTKELLSVRLDFYVQLPNSWSAKKKREKEGKSKNEIQADAIRTEIVKSPLMLNRTYKFYEIIKDEIGWI